MRSADITKVENINRGDKFKIRWNLTYLCNYSCDFCIQGNKSKHAEKSKKESIQKRAKICDNIVKFIETKLNKKYNAIDIYLLGGEVTILNDFLDIVEKLVNAKFDGKISIIITTNLSLSKEKIEELISIFKQKRKNMRELHISASYYKQFVSEKEFVEKAKIFAVENRVRKVSAVNYMYERLRKLLKKYRSNKALNKIKTKISTISIHVGYPICIDKDYKEYLEFKKKYKKDIRNIHFIIIKNYKTSISNNLKKKITKEKKLDKNIRVTFNDNTKFYCINNNNIALKLENEESFNSKGYLCDVGIKNISISNTGLVSRCPSCKEKTVIGNMMDGDFELPTEKIVCPSIRCNCSYYGVIEKQ